MPLLRPDIVIFDMDGTTVRHLNPAVLHVLEKADDAIYAARRGLGQIGHKLGIAQAWRRRRSKRKPRLLVHRTLHKLRRKPVEQIVEPCPGVIDLLELLQAHNIPTGLISNGLGQGYGHEILEKFELEPLFAATLFREDITRAKPDPEPLVAMIKRLSVAEKPNQIVWYIGDRAKDVVVALKTNPLVSARIVPIGYGLHAAAMLFDHQFNTDHLVLSFEDWYDVVERILQGPTDTSLRA
jgi:phosphoglycolate phosphatase